MPIEIQPINSDRSDFVGRVSGIDIASGVSTEAAVTIENAMDHYAVLIFPDQVIDDEQQFQFSTQFGPMETATGDLNASNDRRLSMNVNDISNLDENGKVLPRDNRSRLFGLANMLWHSDSSFKPTPAKFSLLSGRSIPEEGGNTEFADMRAAWDALDPDLQQ
jgi:alpha-ketoglutarate-dependent 2,4-dichlorophenoxyacetate dioxygenase